MGCLGESLVGVCGSVLSAAAGSVEDTNHLSRLTIGS